jgi:hypothetical protein
LDNLQQVAAFSVQSQPVHQQRRVVFLAANLVRNRPSVPQSLASSAIQSQVLRLLPLEAWVQVPPEVSLATRLHSLDKILNNYSSNNRYNH